jgi:hypothetical protein
VLFVARLNELRELRALNPKGVPLDELDRIAPYVGYHVAMLENVKGRNPPTKDYVDNVETRLSHAAVFFAEHDVTMLREIRPEHVHEFMVHLETRRVRGKPLTRTTQRQYMDALATCYSEPLVRAGSSETGSGRRWTFLHPSLRPPNCLSWANAHSFWKRPGACFHRTNRAGRYMLFSDFCC